MVYGHLSTLFGTEMLYQFGIGDFQAYRFAGIHQLRQAEQIQFTAARQQTCACRNQTFVNCHHIGHRHRTVEWLNQITRQIRHFGQTRIGTGKVQRVD